MTAEYKHIEDQANTLYAFQAHGSTVREAVGDAIRAAMDRDGDVVLQISGRDDIAISPGKIISHFLGE